MSINAKELSDVIDSLALQEATSCPQIGLDHGSTICRLASDSWQVEVIRSNEDMPKAATPEELRAVMQDPDKPIVFIPGDSFITPDTLEHICIENPLNKMIIVESE